MARVRTVLGIAAAACFAVAATAGDDDNRPASRIVVQTADGKPADGATVTILSLAGFGTHGAWLRVDRNEGMRGGVAPISTRRAVTDAGGVAKLPFGTDHLCLIASREDEGTLQCAVPRSSLEGRVGTYEVRLEPAKALTGRLLGPDGKPVASARLRLAVAGGEEWHFLEAEIAKDGAFRLPPVPGRLLAEPETRLEARAPGCVEARVALGEKDAGREVEVRFARARVVRGRLHAADAIRDAWVRTSNVWHDEQVKAGDDGAFTMDWIPPATRRLYVDSRSHATRVVELPAGDGDADLGVIELEPGRGVNGKLIGPDGRKGEGLTVGLVDDQGWELATTDTDARGVFDVAHAGKDVDHVVVRAGGAGGELWLFERGKLGGEMPAPPFVVKFQGAGGDPVLVEVARLVWSAGDKTETSVVRMVAYTLGVRTVRLRLPGPGSLRVEIDGREPVVLDKVEVAADGTGEATVTVRK